MSAAVASFGLPAPSISDFPIKWSHLLNRGALSPRKRASVVPFPAEDELMLHITNPRASEYDVLIEMPDEETAIEIRTWLKEHAEKSYTLFGRFQWQRLNIRVERNTLGLLVRFKEKDAALYFKMRWYRAH